VTKDELTTMERIVRGAVAEAMLDHQRQCPQAGSIRALFEKADANAKNINGIAASVSRLSDSVESHREVEAAEKKGLSKGLTVGLILASAGGSAGMAAVMKLIPSLFQ
jgi:hypothetical protein